MTILSLSIDSHSQCTLFKFSYLSNFSKIWRSHNIRMKYIATKFSQNLIISCGHYGSALDFRSTVPFSQNVRFLTFRSTLQQVRNGNWLVYLYMYVSRTTILASCWEFFCGFRSGINYHIKKLSANMKLYMLVLKLDGLDSFKNSGKKIRKVRQLIGSKNDKSKLFTY